MGMKIVRFSSLLFAFVLAASAFCFDFSALAGNAPGQNANSSMTATENTNTGKTRRRRGRRRAAAASTAEAADDAVWRIHHPGSRTASRSATGDRIDARKKIRRPINADTDLRGETRLFIYSHGRIRRRSNASPSRAKSRCATSASSR